MTDEKRESDEIIPSEIDEGLESAGDSLQDAKGRYDEAGKMLGDAGDKLKRAAQGNETATKAIEGATSSIKAGHEKAQKAFQTADNTIKKVTQGVERTKKLATDAGKIVTAGMNFLTSLGVIASVLLGAKNIKVADQQLNIANQQLAALGAASSKSAAREAAWQAALETMQINKAVEAGSTAWVGRFEPPAKLLLGKEPGSLRIALQSLVNEPLNGRIEARVTEGGTMVCQLPGCMTPNQAGCECKTPIRYNFVLQQMHLLTVEMPLALVPLSSSFCPTTLSVEYNVKVQNTGGQLVSIDKRLVRYQRKPEDKTCAPGTEFVHEQGDSWEGDAVAGAPDLDAGSDASADAGEAADAAPPTTATDAGSDAGAATALPPK